MNILRSICTASYRIAVLSLLLLILSTQTMANKYLFAIGSMIFKVVGGPAT